MTLSNPSQNSTSTLGFQRTAKSISAEKRI